MLPYGRYWRCFLEPSCSGIIEKPEDFEHAHEKTGFLFRKNEKVKKNKTYQKWVDCYDDSVLQLVNEENNWIPNEMTYMSPGNSSVIFGTTVMVIINTYCTIAEDIT